MVKDSEKKQLPMVDSTEMPESLDCTTCLLPMQYQKKVDGKFVWQFFRCGKNILFLQKTERRLLKNMDHQDNFMYSKIGDYS